MKIYTSTPSIEVGILFADCIRFQLHGNYRHNGKIYNGTYSVERRNNTCILSSENSEETISLPFILEPADYNQADFELQNVTIGILFHWERQENQKFKGTLKLINEGTHLTAVNCLPLEDYLVSVISSEMKATSHPELLKAHAVISRSWLLAQLDGKKQGVASPFTFTHTESEYIRWYDHEDHLHFDVCADDHCQRYQGITKATTPAVTEAVMSTYGQVLTYEEEICDARFSKCCGGISENFENVWEPIVHPYLTTVADQPAGHSPLPDLTREEEARKWILSSPEAFCNTNDQQILSEMLNAYDLETRDFFRWRISYTDTEISALILKKTGIDFGRVTDLIPLQRGNSGRIIRLQITGTRRTMVLGKELVIRKALSPSHLYSSAFIVDKEQQQDSVVFTLHGAGWGHGVGLCQIGAAVMAQRGYDYQSILRHYFPQTHLSELYKR